MTITSAEYTISSPDVRMCPQTREPEYAFIGRSNVGKSSDRKRSKREQEKLVEMIRGYILRRRQMVNLFLLIDSRHAPQRIDLEFIEWLGENGVPFSIVFTKADKQSATRTGQNIADYLTRLGEQWEELPPHFVTSAETRQGRDDVLDYIEQINREMAAS